MGVSRRRVLKSLGAAGLVPVIGSQSFPAPAIAEGGGSIVVSTWGGDTEDSIRKFVQPKFEAKTKATIKYDIGGQGARFNKLLAQRNAPPADVIFLTDEAIVSGYQQDVLIPVSRHNVPNFEHVVPQALTLKNIVDGKSIPGVPYTIISYLLGYNPKKVSAPLTSWNDMWRPEFANKFAFAAPVHTQMPALVIIAAELAGGSAENIDPGFKKLAELRPSKLTVFWTDWAALYQSGDVIAATEFDYYLNGMKKQGFDIDYVVPKEKGIGVPEYVGMVKGTKNHELAEVFMDLLLDTEVQGDFASATFQGPSSNLVKLPAALAEKVAYGPRLAQLRFFDPQFGAKVRPMWTERLNTEVVPHWRAK